MKIKNKIILILFLIVLSNDLFSQYKTLVGKIIDSKTNEPLAFVNIVYGNKYQGVTTDIDGLFSIRTDLKIDSLICSYIGYEKKIVKILDNQKNVIISLAKKEFDLNEVTILPIENPAHRIIKKVIENRDNNNPFKNSSFSYTSYNKMIFTSDVLEDTIAIAASKDTTSTDTILIRKRKAYNFFNKQHLFMIESVNKRVFRFPNKNYEKVVASKISGFKNPIFTLLITQIQAISFYDELFILLDKKYVNPISKGSTQKYFFEIKDTSYIGNDTVFIISYRPRINTNFDGLKGVLSINTFNYAIQNVIAEPSRNEGLFEISIQQQYEIIDSLKWFPTQLNTDFFFKDASVDSYKIVGKGRTYNKDIILNPKLKNSEFGSFDIDLDVEESSENDKILNIFRTDTLSSKELNTYKIIDSLSNVNKFEKKLDLFKTLISGKIPYKNIDIDIDKIINYNEYEGFRLGMGVHTNRNLFKNFILGSYFAYGLKDKYFKYGADIEYFINRSKENSIALEYSNDLIESGKHDFTFDNKSFFFNESIRNMFVNRFDNVEKISLSYKIRIYKYLNSNISFNYKTITPKFDNYFNENIFYERVNVSEIKIGLKLAYKQVLIKSGDWIIKLDSKYPVLYLDYTKGIKNILNSAFEFNRIDFRITKSFQTKYYGKLDFELNAGLVDKKLPLWGVYIPKSGSNKQYLSCLNSFQTMKFNQFASDRYVALFYTHNFGKLLYRSKHFNPNIVIHNNFLIGNLFNNKYLEKSNYIDPSKAYLESGLMINNIFNINFLTLNLGVFYNYGYYSNIDELKNFYFRWTIALPL